MEAQLRAAGWNGGEDVATAYARTTGSPVTVGGVIPGTPTTTTPGAPTTPGGPVLTNPAANKDVLNAAQQAAYQAYLNAKLNLDTDDLAFRKATQAFSEKIQAAALTGTYEGAPTQAAQQQQASITGMYNGMPTEQAREANNKTALDYLNLISAQKGPQDYGTYLRTLGSTPGGLRDLVASAAGQYVPASGATTGVVPTPASLGGLVNAAATGASGQTTYASYMNDIAGLPAPNQIAPASWNAYTQSQKDMLLGAYQSQGWNPKDVQDLYAQSLPRYAYAGGTTGTVKL